MRCALIVCGVIAARAAHADPCPAPATADVDATPRRMAVELGDPPDPRAWTRTLVAGDGSQFPAVSEDGRVVVELFHDQLDFIGRPLATVVFFSRGQRAAAIELPSDAGDASVRPSRAQARLEARALDGVNTRLGRARWRPLAVVRPCESDDGGTSSLALGDDVHLGWSYAGRSLVEQIGTERPRWIHRAFPSPAQPDAGASRRTCTVTGVDRAFGTRAIGFAVLVPRVGGDGCLGTADAALAIALPIP